MYRFERRDMLHRDWSEPRVVVHGYTVAFELGSDPAVGDHGVGSGQPVLQSVVRFAYGAHHP